MTGEKTPNATPCEAWRLVGQPDSNPHDKAVEKARPRTSLRTKEPPSSLTQLLLSVTNYGVVMISSALSPRIRGVEGRTHQRTYWSLQVGF